MTSPWGNRLRCFEPHRRFGRITLGLCYVQFDVPVGTAAAIARFYREVFDTPARQPMTTRSGGQVLRSEPHQDFIFRGD